jgi:hypothetical protein
MSPPVISHSWDMLRIYAKVEHVIGLKHPPSSDIKEVCVYPIS